MSQYFFKEPFATDGDVTTIPLDTQPDGTVSYQEGWGSDYEADPSDPDVKYPERRVINQVLKALTGAMQILQVHGFPDFITTSDNGGTPYSYDANSFVRYGGIVYYSLVDSNTALPTDDTKWAQWITPSPFKTGMTIIHEDSSLPAGGWVWANGQTIGDGSSGGTGRANADTLALFTQIWNAFPQSIRPVTTSAGGASTRGVSAAADFAAHKRIPLRDMRGNAPAGYTAMGGATDAANLKPVDSKGVDGSIFGASGGEGLGHTPTLAEMFQHAHGSSSLVVVVGNHQHLIANTNTVQNFGTPLDATHAMATIGRITSGTDNSYSLVNTPTGGGTATADVGLSSPQINAGASSISGNSDTNGSGNAFNVVQPTTICNFITKL